MPAVLCSSDLAWVPEPPVGIPPSALPREAAPAPAEAPPTRLPLGAHPGPLTKQSCVDWLRPSPSRTEERGCRRHESVLTRGLICQALAFRDDKGEIGFLPSSAAEPQQKTAHTTRKEYCNASLCFTHLN